MANPNRREYTEEERWEALELYRKEGPSVAAKQLGIPKSTLSGWARSRGVRTISTHRMAESLQKHKLSAAEKRARIAQRFLDNADSILDMIENPTETVSGGKIITTNQPTPSQLKDLMVSTSISVEKHLELETFTGPEQEHYQNSVLDQLASKLGVNELDEEFPN